MFADHPDEAAQLIDVTDDEGDAAIHYAAYSKKPQSINSLMNFGADVNAVNEKGSTPLHIAVLVQDLPSVKLLLSHAQINTCLQDSFGDTPLHEAVVKGSNDILDALCEDQQPPFMVANQRGFNVFQYAALKGNLYAVQQMSQRSPVLTGVPKADGFTPLSIAALNGHQEVVRYLLNLKETNMLALNHRGQNCLHCAVDQGHVEVLDLLLEIAEKKSLLAQLLNCRDVEGDTPLHITLRREGQPSSALKGQTNWSKAFQDTFQAVILSGTVPQIQLLPVSVAAFLILKDKAALNVKNKAGLKPLDYIIDPHIRNWLRLQSEEQGVQAEQESTSNTRNSQLPLECQICCEVMKAKEGHRPVKFEPCGHIIVCSECCTRMKRCLECKAPIDKKVVVKDDIETSDTDDEVKSLKTMRLRDLEDKNRIWEEHYSCPICMERKKNVAFLCGHGACDVCVQTLVRCHMCRGSIKQKIKLF